MTTPVIFRRWKTEHGGIIALFPTIPEDVAGHLCTSYQHVGQHGGADYLGVVAATWPTRGDEHLPLLSELKQIGYDDLVVIQKATPEHRTQRMRAARGLLGRKYA